MIRKLIPAALSVFALSAMAAGDAAQVGVGVGLGMGAGVREKQSSESVQAKVNARASVDAQAQEREELRRAQLQKRQPSALGGAVGSAISR